LTLIFRSYGDSIRSGWRPVLNAVRDLVLSFSIVVFWMRINASD